MKKLIAFGTFDIFHPGHEFYLQEARKLGDYLLVVIARDKNVLKAKGKKARNSEEERLISVRDTGLADGIVLGSLEDKYEALEQYQPDVVVLGYDQEVNEEELLKKLAELKLECQIKRIRAFKPEIYKSSKLKKRDKE